MRRSREDTIETRAKIVAIASRLSRARGIQATSVADVMADAGLTVGGFYRHFDKYGGRGRHRLVAELASDADPAHERRAWIFDGTSQENDPGPADAIRAVAAKRRGLTLSATERTVEERRA